jgi:long-chain acyl-CoA synthetase
VVRENRVGLCSPDSVDVLLAIIGAWKVGALPSMLDPRTPADQLPSLVSDIGASVMLCSEEQHSRLEAAGAENLTEITAAANGPGSWTLRHDHTAPLFLSYTSGTTGAPKGAILTSGPVTLGTACIADRLGLRQEDVLLVTTPSASSFQLVAALLPAIHVGATVGLASGAGVDEIWQLASMQKSTVLIGYPLTLADVVNHRSGGVQRVPFRLALSGGSPLAPRIHRDYSERFGIPLVESYGQSEFGGFMALGSPYDPAVAHGFVGRPLPDRLAIIAAPDGRELPAGEVGEVTVPAGFFREYLNRPEETAKALLGGVLHCGDAGIADNLGRIKVLGRIGERKNAKERGGFLREAEDAYYEIPAVLHAVVVQTQRGDIEAFVELRNEGKGDQATATLATVPDLPANLMPARTTILNAMPRTFSGKADRRMLTGGVLGRSLASHQAHDRSDKLMR